MNDTLTKAEEKLFIKKQDWAYRLLPVCEALKLAGYETATIADIMQHIQEENSIPLKFSIVNNRYLVHKPDMVYDLHKSEPVWEQPNEPKKVAIIFWP